MAEETKTPETSETSTKKLKDGSELSIDEFLQKIDLSKYTDIFKEEEVTMDILKTFNDDDLRNIGIDKYGPRKKILNSITSLEHQGKIFYSIYFQTVVISKDPYKIDHHNAFISIRPRRSGSNSISFIRCFNRISTICSTNACRTIRCPFPSSSNL